MGHSEKVEKAEEKRKVECSSSRREFCQKVPCAAVGVWASTSLIGPDAVNRIVPGFNFSSEEEAVANVITAKVISQKGSCAQGHKVGDKIIITESEIKGKMCIHALYSTLPKVFALMFDAKFPWLENADVSTSACPDAYNPVVFEFSREKE